MTDKLLGHKSNVTADLLHPFEGSLDDKDPIYDSESEADAYLEAYQPSRLNNERHEYVAIQSTYARSKDVETSKIQEPLQFQEFLTIVTEKILPDAFASEDSGAACDALKALHSHLYHDSFVAKAVRASLDLSTSKQQWMSELLTILYDSKIITRAQFNKGFEKLIQQIDDIRLDVPEAYWKVFTFFRCGVDDDVIDPSFTLRLPQSFLQGLLLTRESRDLSEVEVHMKKLKSYKSQLASYIVNDFLTSGSLEDLPQLLKDLEHSEFQHEVVKQLIKTAMGLTNIEREHVSTALSDCFGRQTLGFSPDDILVGFVRVVGEIEDIKIDVPDAPSLLAKFVVRAVADEILPPVFVLDCIRLGFGGEEGRKVMRTVKKWVVEESKGKAQVARFRKIWVTTHPDKPETREFKEQICNIIHEHFADEDFSATRAAIEELDMTPDQAADFVRKTLELSMERAEREQEAAITLLQCLVTSGDIDCQSIITGFEATTARLHEVTQIHREISWRFGELKAILNRQQTALQRLISSAEEGNTRLPPDAFTIVEYPHFALWVHISAIQQLKRALNIYKYERVKWINNAAIESFTSGSTSDILPRLSYLETTIFLKLEKLVNTYGKAMTAVAAGPYQRRFAEVAQNAFRRPSILLPDVVFCQRMARLARIDPKPGVDKWTFNNAALPHIEEELHENDKEPTDIIEE